MMQWLENIMQGFMLKHEDMSDSYLRKAYTNMDLHTDGTYVKEITDWSESKVSRTKCRRWRNCNVTP